MWEPNYVAGRSQQHVQSRWAGRADESQGPGILTEAIKRATENRNRETHSICRGLELAARAEADLGEVASSGRRFHGLRFETRSVV